MRALSNAISKNEGAVPFGVQRDRFEVETAECTGVIKLVQHVRFWSVSRFCDLRGFALELNPEIIRMPILLMVRKLSDAQL